MTMDKQNKPPLIVILGPTACGKTELSLAVARRFDGEIISADSMQVYRGMDIGTAKITPREAGGIRHWLIDVRDPDQGFSVAEFRQEAISCIEDVRRRGKRPILCGGTGLYVDSLLKIYHFPLQGEADPDIRRRLREELERDGAQALHQRLQTVDPEAAARIHVNDSHRLIHALEVWESGGVALSQLWREPGQEPPYRSICIGLLMARELLYHRIEQRVEEMLAQGLVEEVRRLLLAGVGEDAVAMQGLGYRQFLPYLRGECDLAAAVDLLKRDTRRFAKRQLTWFKRNEEITWFYRDHYREEDALQRDVCALISRRLKEGEGVEGIAGTIPEQLA